MSIKIDYTLLLHDVLWSFKYLTIFNLSKRSLEKTPNILNATIMNK